MADSCAASRSTGLHVMAQLAGCRRAVGVALWSRPRMCELRGPTAELERIAGQLGGFTTTSAHCVRWRSGWWQAESQHRLLALADPSRQVEFDRLLAVAAASSPDVAMRDVSALFSSLVLVGPLAGRLGLAARRDRPTMVAADGEHCQFLVVPAWRAEDANRALLQAGRHDGALAIDVSAANLYRAARRVVTTQQPAPHHLSFDPPPKGALLP